MSIDVGNGFLITYMETDVVCPICNKEFNCGDKADKARYPMFKMRCPGCKSQLQISMPIMGGTTTVTEVNPPKTKADNTLKYVAPFLINGKEENRKPYDTDGEDKNILV